MNAVVEYRSRESFIQPEVGYEECGGIVEEILRRLGKVETDVSELKADVSELKPDVRGILTTIPYLATKADVSEVKTEIAGLRTELKVEIAGMESKIIKWFIATALAIATAAFAFAKYLH